MSSTLNFLDLFAGAGGMSEGFIRAGFRPVAHVEADLAACYTLKTRQAYHWLLNNKSIDIYKQYLENQISRDELYSAVPTNEINAVINETINRANLDHIFHQIDRQLNNSKLDLVIGGPPCQAYSLVGRARRNMEQDPRNYLYVFYAEFLKRYNPKYFVFENVMGLLTAKDCEGNLYFDQMRKLFVKNGYDIDFRILAANNYGVLQNRKRIILVGKKHQPLQQSFYPDPEPWTPNASVWDLLTDLPTIPAGGGQTTPQSLIKAPSKWLKQEA